MVFGIFTSNGSDEVKLLNVNTTNQIRVDAGLDDDRVSARQTGTDGLSDQHGQRQ